ncbi:Pituitary tumor-transforming protein1 protein-interacting protein [Holothuria leucospilota]|uniref:Pituitary tumor-transforming protein1 protein-interacting protein n=1 Tax=Holothuria leucospilota TaxID=206669 RepID=A0A9Q0YR02_HOLLE|nr:Pituitary tumor-transforming protein1 protein-interacting protein [Holothuria leucospilota]
MMVQRRLLVTFLVILSVVCLLYVDATPTPPSTPTSSSRPTPKPDPEKECSEYSGPDKCEDCVRAAGAKCMFCFTGNKCMKYPAGDIIPKSKDCDLSKLRWGTCAINFKALLISMGVIAGVIILSLSCCIVYCCCCRGPSGRQRRKWAKEDAKEERKKAERQMKQDQRKAERQARNDEIRRKYGLLQNESDDEDNDNEPLTQTEQL